MLPPWRNFYGDILEGGKEECCCIKKIKIENLTLTLLVSTTESHCCYFFNTIPNRKAIIKPNVSFQAK
jgi:hypothetical protein